MTDTEGFVDPTVTGLAEPQPTYKALPESSPVFRSPHAFVVIPLADIELALKHPDPFSSNTDAVDLGHSVVLVSDVPGNIEARAVAAEQNCPEGAVSLSR